MCVHVYICVCVGNEERGGGGVCMCVWVSGSVVVGGDGLEDGKQR